jgi:hypothetical protein
MPVHMGVDIAAYARIHLKQLWMRLVCLQASVAWCSPRMGQQSVALQSIKMTIRRTECSWTHPCS